MFLKGGPMIKTMPINGRFFNPQTISLLFFVLLLAASSDATRSSNADTKFDEMYKMTWGDSHIGVLDDGLEAQLLLDNTSGAGFESKLMYASGFFEIKMKMPIQNSSGIVTSFYLSSVLDGQPGGNHNELDFEYLGGSGPNHTLQTNVFSLDYGRREQRINLWFDPTLDFHTYAILWNQHQIVFYVDNKPIRVFKNNTKIGVAFPTKEMQARASIWNASWAADPGVKIDWSKGPFVARYRVLGLLACQFQNPSKQNCYDTKNNFWWNTRRFWDLSPKENQEYQKIRNNYLLYDYCWKKWAMHKECQEIS